MYVGEREFVTWWLSLATAWCLVGGALVVRFTRPGVWIKLLSFLLASGFGFIGVGAHSAVALVPLALLFNPFPSHPISSGDFMSGIVALALWWAIAFGVLTVVHRVWQRMRPNQPLHPDASRASALSAGERRR